MYACSFIYLLDMDRAAIVLDRNILLTTSRDIVIGLFRFTEDAALVCKTADNGQNQENSIFTHFPCTHASQKKFSPTISHNGRGLGEYGGHEEWSTVPGD